MALPLISSGVIDKEGGAKEGGAKEGIGTILLRGRPPTSGSRPILEELSVGCEAGFDSPI